jgi:4-diphosphocytidyl-2-C-methyl-D-erythritol kinase
MAAVTIRAFAKINLSLRVKAARPDGFHEVQTILQTIDLSDRLVCEARRVPFEIICSPRIAEVPTDRTNLIWKAAQRLWNAAGRDGQPLGSVRLDKKIPVKAGLGGGSSDAAAALLALRRVWKLRVPDEELHAIAAGLGCDVPYFLVGGTALGLGRGEEIYPLADLPRCWVVVIIPPFGIATSDAYAWWDHARACGFKTSEARHLRGTWLSQVIPLVNDLEAAVVKRHPVIGKLRDRLTALGATLSAMSGSGSAVFGVFTTPRAAAAAARTLARSGARTLVARMKNRSNRL